MSRSRKRAKPIAASSLAMTIIGVLEQHTSTCLDDEDERADLSVALVLAIMDRPEAIAIRAAFAKAPTQGTKLIVMREVGGDREGELLGAMARLAGAS